MKIAILYASCQQSSARRFALAGSAASAPSLGFPPTRERTEPVTSRACPSVRGSAPTPLRPAPPRPLFAGDERSAARRGRALRRRCARALLARRALRPDPALPPGGPSPPFRERPVHAAHPALRLASDLGRLARLRRAPGRRRAGRGTGRHGRPARRRGDLRRERPRHPRRLAWAAPCLGSLRRNCGARLAGGGRCPLVRSRPPRAPTRPRPPGRKGLALRVLRPGIPRRIPGTADRRGQRPGRMVFLQRGRGRRHVRGGAPRGSPQTSTWSRGSRGRSRRLERRAASSSARRRSARRSTRSTPTASTRVSSARARTAGTTARPPRGSPKG